jgi:hypothetical protein
MNKPASLKAIRAHIESKLYASDLDLDVTRSECGQVRIVGRNVDKSFKTERAAKSYVTKLDNQLLYAMADSRLALGY